MQRQRDRAAYTAGRAARRGLLLSLALLLSVFGAPRAGAEEDVPPAGWDVLPLWLTEECETPGTMEEFWYFSHSPGHEDALAGIYLPAGYDPEGRYDVVYLWPGSGGDYRAALESEHLFLMEDGQRHPLTARHLIDRMIERGEIRPFLLLCMNDNTGNRAAVARDDTRDMLRLLERDYAVWTEDDAVWTTDGATPGEEVRRHYTFLGYSQGSVFSEGVGMVNFFDRFAHFGAISFGSSWRYIPQVVESSPLELGLLYVLTGDETDYGADQARSAYELITSGCPEKIRDGDNALLRQTDRCGHGYELLTMGLYDLLPRILPPEE